MPYVRESAIVGGKEIIVETGKWAKQAGGSVVIRCGDSMVLVTAAGSTLPRDIDFMPLTCEYQEKFYSSGKIPGSFFRREGRSTNAEILVARLMDRPVRPLFPKGWFIDTQIIANVVSFDRHNATDVLAMTGASAALHISDLVWDGPLAGVRVGRVDGQFIANPTFAEREKSEMDIIVAASKDAIMVVACDRLGTALQIKDKMKRYAEVAAVKTEALTTIQGEGKLNPAVVADNKAFEAAFGKLHKKWARGHTLETRKRIDGRNPDEIRAITIETGVLPRAHGSALFTRGETQALVAVTLGTKYDEKKLDTLLGDQKRTFYMDYNFPPFSTGEVKPLRGQSRREGGHGFLAERSVEAGVPEYEDFPYTIRGGSDILESNGSSSMASVCGGSLALMDAGVPTKNPVAGIAMGLMKEGNDYVILSDILGDEDHLGDMDFKVTGTRRGVCALQMDIKVDGLTRQILEEALEQAKRGRIHILDKMDAVISAPRDEVSVYAPRIVTVQVKPDKVRDIIGPGGKTIRAIQEQTGAQIDINDSGIVSIASSDAKAIEQAQALISGLTMEPEVGLNYNGIVKKIVEIGAFVEILPGTDGLLHISEVSKDLIRAVEDVLSEGDEDVVKCN